MIHKNNQRINLGFFMTPNLNLFFLRFIFVSDETIADLYRPGLKKKILLNFTRSIQGLQSKNHHYSPDACYKLTKLRVTY